jgi:hypothetical protein
VTDDDLPYFYRCVTRRFEGLELTVAEYLLPGVLESLYDAGYRVTSQGPYCDREMFPRVDPSRVKLTVERDLP